MSVTPTLDEVKAFLTIDHDDDDAQLTTLIGAAVRQVDLFIKIKDEQDYSDYQTDDIRTATIFLVEAMYEKTPQDDWKEGLPRKVYMILWPYRTPTLA